MVFCVTCEKPIRNPANPSTERIEPLDVDMISMSANASTELSEFPHVDNISEPANPSTELPELPDGDNRADSETISILNAFSIDEFINF